MGKRSAFVLFALLAWAGQWATARAVSTGFGVNTSGRADTVVAPGPLISGFAPAYVQNGNALTINGQNLQGVTQLKIGEANQQAFTVNDAGTQITTTVPGTYLAPSTDPAAGRMKALTTGYVRATTPGGTAISPTRLRIFSLADFYDPALGYNSPPLAPFGLAISVKNGDRVYLKGSGFLGATEASFGGDPQGGSDPQGGCGPVTTLTAAPVVLNDSMLYVPFQFNLAGLRSPNVSPSVTTPLGQATMPIAPIGGRVRTIVITSSFASCLAPASGPAGTRVAVSGYFTRSALTFNGIAGINANFIANGRDGSSTVFADVPPGLSPGPVDVVVVTGPAADPSLTLPFTLTTGPVAPAAPVLAGLAPASGPVGTSVTLNGSNLAGATSIAFGGTSDNTVSTGFAVNSAGTLLTGVIVPAGAQTGAVTVATPGGISNGVAFTVTTPAPDPADLVVSTGTLASPVAVPPGTYNSITVTGTGIARFGDGIVVNASVRVLAGGVAIGGCQPLTGAASFALEAGATLNICDPAGIAATGGTGAVQTTGPRSFSLGASYWYVGTQAQATGSGLPAQVLNLVVANASGLTLSQGVAINQVLNLVQGRLTTAGRPLTLLSSAAGTALVVNQGSGTVVGTGTMQRYLDASGNDGPGGYRHYSAPVAGSTVADLTTTATGGSFAPVVNPTYNTSAAPADVTPYPTVFGYDELLIATSIAALSDFDKGYYSPAAPSDALAVGRGYAVQIGNTELVDFSGTFNTGNVAIDGLTRGPSPDAGWHLVGNPYPAPLDWGTVGAANTGGSGLAGVDAAAYVFQSTGPYVGRYRAFVNGVGAGTGVLAAGQGFFVRASTPGTPGRIALTNANRLTSFAAGQPALQRGPASATRPLVRLSLGLGARPATPATAQDEAFVYFEAGAAAGFDGAFDAHKLANPSGYYLATAAQVPAGAAPVALAVDGRAPLPAGSAEAVVPVLLAAPVGSYTLTATELANFTGPLGGAVYLRDGLAGTLTDLAQTPSYSFAVAAGAARSGRFALVLRPAAALATAGPGLAQALATVYPNPAATGSACTLAVTGLPASVRRLEAVLVNAVGQEVGRFPLAAALGAARLRLPTVGLASGVYLLRLTALDAQGQATGRLPVQRFSLL